MLISTAINELDELIRSDYIHFTQPPLSTCTSSLSSFWPSCDRCYSCSQLSDHQLSAVRAQRSANMTDCCQSVTYLQARLANKRSPMSYSRIRQYGLPWVHLIKNCQKFHENVFDRISLKSDKQEWELSDSISVTALNKSRLSPNQTVRLSKPSDVLVRTREPFLDKCFQNWMRNVEKKGQTLFLML